MTTPFSGPNDTFFTFTATLMRAVEDGSGGVNAPAAYEDEWPSSGILPHDADFDNFEVQGTFIAQEAVYLKAIGVNIRVGDIFILNEDPLQQRYRVERVNWWPRGTPLFIECVLDRAP